MRFLLLRAGVLVPPRARLLLEDAAARGEPCRVVVAQPRRLAATSLAHRVSAELGEAEVGGLCGYAVRGESRRSARTALEYVATARNAPLGDDEA